MPNAPIIIRAASPLEIEYRGDEFDAPSPSISDTTAGVATSAQVAAATEMATGAVDKSKRPKPDKKLKHKKAAKIDKVTITIDGKVETVLEIKGRKCEVEIEC